MKIYFTLLILPLVTLTNCRKRTSSELRTEVARPGLAVEEFSYEPGRVTFQELAARIGCAEAKRWILSPKEPILKTLPLIRQQKVPYDFIKSQIFEPGNAACPAGITKTNMDGIKTLHGLVTKKGYSLTMVLVGGFGSHLSKEGAISLSRAKWASALPKDSFRIERVECTPNSYATDDECTPIVKIKIEALVAAESKVGSEKPHLYLLWGYSKGGTLATQVLAQSPILREKVIGLITVGAPFGGGLPSTKLVPAFERLNKGKNTGSVKEQMRFDNLMRFGAAASDKNDLERGKARVSDLFTPDQFPKAQAGLVSLLPENREKVLRKTMPSWNLSRTTPHPLIGGLNTPIFHVSSVADITKFNVIPDITINGDSKLVADPNSVQTAQNLQLAMISELTHYPMSDLCVALEHSVIPKFALPKGAAPELITLLQLDHLGLSLSSPGTPDSPPGEAIVDAIIDTVAQRLGAKL